MHGLGIVSLGFLMDAIAEYFVGSREEMVGAFAYALDGLAPSLRVDGRLLGIRPDDRRKWNELQNTPRDIQLLPAYLLRLLADQRADIKA